MHYIVRILLPYLVRSENEQPRSKYRGKQYQEKRSLKQLHLILQL